MAGEGSSQEANVDGAVREEEQMRPKGKQGTRQTRKSPESMSKT